MQYRCLICLTPAISWLDIHSVIALIDEVSESLPAQHSRSKTTMHKLSRRASTLNLDRIKNAKLTVERAVKVWTIYTRVLFREIEGDPYHSSDY